MLPCHCIYFLPLVLFQDLASLLFHYKCTCYTIYNKTLLLVEVQSKFTLELNQNSLRVDLYCILQEEEALPGAVPISQTLGCSTRYALHQAERGECSQGDVWIGWLSWSLPAKCCADINLYCQGACSCCPGPHQLLCSANTKLRSQFRKSPKCLYTLRVSE